uniref:C-type lectin domain-containing protein n=1 Tax=Strongyloides papillosus TaxID=174720 RepID=A0A0N5BVM7_STREA
MPRYYFFHYIFFSILYLSIICTDAQNYDPETQKLLKDFCNDLPMSIICRGKSFNEIRKAPTSRVNAKITPLAFGRSLGNDATFEVPGLGNIGVADTVSNIARFIPEGTENEVSNGGKFDVNDSGVKYTKSELATGRSNKHREFFKIAGIGTFDNTRKIEKGAGFDSLFKNIMPNIGENLEVIETTEKPKSIYDALELNKYINQYEGKIVYKPTLKDPFVNNNGRKEFPTLLSSNSNNLNDNSAKTVHQYKPLLKENVIHGTKIIKDPFNENNKTEVIDGSDNSDDDVMISSERILNPSNIPLSDLGLKKDQIFKLCSRFAPIAAKHCYSAKVEEAFIDKCRGYSRDCQQFIGENKPLGAIANLFNSGVGITMYNWGVNGIPFYAINEEGGIGNGHNGRADFGSWGGGWSENVGIRDFWTQTKEVGGNWYDGNYGYKTGWHVPIVQSLGIEGGSGTHIHVPVNEADLGNPIEVSNGYHVGPYIGLSEGIGVDWMNGGVSANQGFAIPFVGVNANSGTAIAFPSVGTFARMMGIATSPTYSKPIPIKNSPSL